MFSANRRSRSRRFCDSRKRIAANVAQIIIAATIIDSKRQPVLISGEPGVNIENRRFSA
jgi:hypothetical protein